MELAISRDARVRRALGLLGFSLRETKCNNMVYPPGVFRRNNGLLPAVNEVLPACGIDC